MSFVDIIGGHVSCSGEPNTAAAEFAALDTAHTCDAVHDSKASSPQPISLSKRAMEVLSILSPLSQSTGNHLTHWALHVQGTNDVNLATAKLLEGFAKGGLHDTELFAKELQSLTPPDIGVWEGDGFAAFYMDDAMTRSIVSSSEAKRQIIMFLRISVVERIPLGWPKAKILCKWVRLLGMICDGGTVLPCPEKVKDIVLLVRPDGVKALQRFKGSVGWFRRHISDYAELEFALNALCKKGADWRWEQVHEDAWLNLKRRLMTFPVLHNFDPKLPTIMYTDASDVHVGGVLTQTAPDGSKRVIAYYSRSLKGPELSYPVQQKEMFGIVASSMAFEHYLLCTIFKTRVCTDHKSLADSYVGLCKVACNRINRWCQKLGVFNMTLEYLPGVLNDVADLLSRSMAAPEDAWKSMDVIDAEDFHYAPLLVLCPQYLHYAHLYSAEIIDDANPAESDQDYDEKNDDPDRHWLPHESNSWE